MKKYENVISIVNKGTDKYDAGEKAGKVFDGKKIERGMTMSCDSTHAVFYGSAKQPIIGEKRESGRKYETVIRIENEARDETEAREKVGELIDASKMVQAMVISYGPTFLK